jgi:beta-lactamase class A
MMRRRSMLAGAGSALVGASVLRAAPSAFGGVAFGGRTFRDSVAVLEAASRGRMGVAILDTHSGARFGWRAEERFPMCSTFKLLLAGAILRRVDREEDRLDRRVGVAAADIIANSPFAKTRVGGEASVAELCEAALTLSDNAAANLLLLAIGGPAGLTRVIRSFGDPITRFDRNEPTLNEALPGDPRDTTTPRAMLGLLDRLTLGRLLSPASRAQLLAWIVANRTGDHRLRAGLPPGWRIGEKTGAGSRGSDNDVAILWPPKRAPLLVTSYLTGNPLSLAEGDAIHARLGGLIAGAL